MGCCLLAMIGSFFPRIALALMWIFTTYVDRAFSSFIVPLLGLIFLPFTTIMYCLVWSTTTHGVHGAAWIWVILGLMIDISSYASGGYGQRTRTSGAG
jgi:hypothetical protein